VVRHLHRSARGKLHVDAAPCTIPSHTTQQAAQPHPKTKTTRVQAYILGLALPNPTLTQLWLVKHRGMLGRVGWGGRTWGRWCVRGTSSRWRVARTDVWWAGKVCSSFLLVPSFQARAESAMHPKNKQKQSDVLEGSVT
jgi:hypothetical protein